MSEVCILRLIDTLLGWSWHDNRLSLRTPAATISLTPLTEDLIRLQVEETGGLLVLDSGAAIKRDWASVDAGVSAEGGRLVLSAGRMRAEVELSPVRIHWYEGARHLASDLAFIVHEDHRISVTRTLPAGEHCYGFGEKTGYLDKRGRRMEMWTTDQGVMTHTDPLYQSIPFYVALRDGKAHGLFVDCTARSRFDMGSLDPAETCTIEVHSPLYDAYVFAGPDMRAVVSRYTELTGRTPLPPLWSLAYHQCRYSYYPEAKVREIARLFREKEIPCDALWLDIDYMDGYRVFTWDQERFPDPGALNSDLALEGFRVVTIVDPGVKVDPDFPVYQEGVAKGYFCKNPDGTVFVGTVWPGPSAFPDFLQAGARRWWGDWHREAYLDQGIAGIWNDMNEPANLARNEDCEKTLPYQTRQGEDGRQVPHKDVHNAYGFRMSQATYEGLQRHRPEHRPFVLTRSGYAGIQRYAAVWTGDNYSWWEGMADAMPLCLGLSLSGVAFVGGDVGGFGENPGGELMARWMQLGAFTPFFRTHAAKGSRDQEPWSFGPVVEAICKRYIELRYRLLPYWYSLFAEAARTGLPPMRPLVLEYQEDPETRHVGDQFLVGRDLLVAPVAQPGITRRLVYLPEGTWFDFWTGRHYEGKQHVVSLAPLETLPLFVRAGAVLPMWPVMDHVGARPVERLTLHLFAGKGEFTLYEDAGDGYGPSAQTVIAVTPHGARVGAPDGGFTPPWREVELLLHGTPSTIQIDGHPVETTPAEGGAVRALVRKPGGFDVQWR